MRTWKKRGMQPLVIFSYKFRETDCHLSVKSTDTETNIAEWSLWCSTRTKYRGWTVGHSEVQPGVLLSCSLLDAIWDINDNDTRNAACAETKLHTSDPVLPIPHIVTRLQNDILTSQDGKDIIMIKTIWYSFSLQHLVVLLYKLS